MNVEKEFNDDQRRTEEVQEIIERIPTSFGFWVSAIVILLFILMFVFGWFIRYPDVIVGQINVNTNIAPLKLIANSSGKLKLNGIKSLESVKEGQIIAYVENATNPTSVIFVDSLLKLFNPSTDAILILHEKLPGNLSLGELNVKYYTFINSLQEFLNYKKDKLHDKQKANLTELLKEQQKAIFTAEKRVEIGRNSLNYAHKFYARDSTLYAKKVISESELDKTQMSYISGRDALEGAVNNQINTKQAAQQTVSKLQELGIQSPEKEKQLRIALISTYNDLADNIKSWVQKYVFRSPFTGTVQFLKFYSENQFIQSGEPIFTIIPAQERVFGQVILPVGGSGKIKKGQEVIVKLDNYPYMEYGSIRGEVNSISITTNSIKTEKNEIETYMVLVDFPNQLKTNYGTELDFKAEAKGKAEIITSDRRLVQRLFDNLKYIMKK